MADNSTLDNILSCAQVALETRGSDIVVLDVGKLSSVTDYYLLVSGSSDRRVQSIAQAMLEKMGERGVRPLGVEGLREGRWVLVDFGDWVAHIFYEELREYYDLEGLWFDAPRVQVPKEVSAPARSSARGK
jgi:ribosome-associated protein